MSNFLLIINFICIFISIPCNGLLNGMSIEDAQARRGTKRAHAQDVDDSAARKRREPYVPIDTVAE